MIGNSSEILHGKLEARSAKLHDHITLPTVVPTHCTWSWKHVRHTCTGQVGNFRPGYDYGGSRSTSESFERLDRDLNFVKTAHGRRASRAQRRKWTIHRMITDDALNTEQVKMNWTFGRHWLYVTSRSTLYPEQFLEVVPKRQRIFELQEQQFLLGFLSLDSLCIPGFRYWNSQSSYWLLEAVGFYWSKLFTITQVLTC